MATRMKRLHLSPSEFHAHLLMTTERKMAFNGGDVKKWQRGLRSKLKEFLGYTYRERRDPLRVRSLWKRKHRLGTIEKITFTSEPRADVLAYVCLPKRVDPPYKWFICVQGHSSGMHNSIAVERDDNTKPFRVGGDRDFGLGCLRRGIAALCIEQRAFGERRELRINIWDQPPTCHHPAMQGLMLGKTLIGQRIFDVDRGIDYLATRDDVDMKHLGIMGNSGGGTISMFSAAVLPRLQYCMPSCYFCSFEHSIMAMGHCWCNYIPNLLACAEMSDVMGLFAPRPVVIVAGREDDIFPIEATRTQFKKLKRIYRAAGAPDRCHLVEGTGGHRFYAGLAWPQILKEMNRHL